MLILNTNQNKYTLHIVNDPDPINPREDCSFGTIYYVSSRYTLGDKKVSSDELESLMKDPSLIYLKVYAYIHSGIVLNTAGFSCSFDSGMSGIIAISKDEVRKSWNVSRISKGILAKVYEGLKSEVETYSKYLSGEAYGYEIHDNHGEVIDSCYGFFDREDCESEGKSALKFALGQQATINGYLISNS